MELIQKLNYYCTPEGLKILERNPNFIDSVWLNESCREFLGSRNGKDFTKIHDGKDVYVEKTGTSFRELERYFKIDEIIQEQQFKHIKSAENYFGDENKILLKYYPYNFDSYIPSNIELKEEVSEEFYTFCHLTNYNEFGIKEDGDLIVLDPHF